MWDYSREYSINPQTTPKVRKGSDKGKSEDDGMISLRDENLSQRTRPGHEVSLATGVTLACFHVPPGNDDRPLPEANPAGQGGVQHSRRVQPRTLPGGQRQIHEERELHPLFYR
ncbi:hypothetical protein NFI96_032753 [Prochilodus magdalenae]|nr:hypothetical protein NFI96_032753 [Prochilodus magdalenae]